MKADFNINSYIYVLFFLVFLIKNLFDHLITYYLKILFLVADKKKLSFVYFVAKVVTIKTFELTIFVIFSIK